LEKGEKLHTADSKTKKRMGVTENERIRMKKKLRRRMGGLRGQLFVRKGKNQRGKKDEKK